jgi:hypothetical protein
VIEELYLLAAMCRGRCDNAMAHIEVTTREKP